MYVLLCQLACDAPVGWHTSQLVGGTAHPTHQLWQRREGEQQCGCHARQLLNLGTISPTPQLRAEQGAQAQLFAQHAGCRTSTHDTEMHTRVRSLHRGWLITGLSLQ